MSFMNRCKVEFNGNDLTMKGLYNVTVDGNIKPNIFAASKQINTAKAMYGRRNVITGINTDVLQFDLTFTMKDASFTEEICANLYKMFETITYKPLRFDEQDIYFNAIPMVNSQSDMYNFYNDAGYFTIPFVCDAGHGWVDRHYHFERVVGETSGIPWHIDNPCNVKDHDGFYRVYPYIEIELPMFQPDVTEKAYHIGFGLSTEAQSDWFRLHNISQNQTIIIDNENKQMYSSAGDNLLIAMDKNIRFFYLDGGENTIYHETLVGDETISSSYNIDFYLSCPYMW